MVAAVGCPAESLLHTSPGEHEHLAEAGEQLGLETILAIMQILDHTLARLRYSTQGRTLAEMALVRIANLEDLDELAELDRASCEPARRCTAAANARRHDSRQPRSRVSDRTAKKKQTVSSRRPALTMRRRGAGLPRPARRSCRRSRR